MPFEIPADLDPALLPLAFLIGDWAGAGLGQYPTIEDFRFGQEVSFAYVPGKQFLDYESRSWLIDERGEKVRPLAREHGYWRPQPDKTLEVLLAHPTGFLELYIGTVAGTRVELATDAVVRTATAKEVRSGHRLYGIVEGALLYAVDMAAMGQPLQPHLSARLERVGG